MILCPSYVACSTSNILTSAFIHTRPTQALEFWLINHYGHLVFTTLLPPMSSLPLNHPSIIFFLAILIYVALCASIVIMMDRGFRGSGRGKSSGIENSTLPSIASPSSPFVSHAILPFKLYHPSHFFEATLYIVARCANVVYVMDRGATWEQRSHRS